MVWRGIGARRLLSLTIFTLTALVVSGTVVAVAFSRLTEVSRGSAAVLVLLGFVALSAQSVESVRRREAELALARLRGRRGLRLMTFAVAEPCLVVLGGAVAGVVAGWFVTRLVVGFWLAEGTDASLGNDEWAAAALVAVASLLLVVASCWRITRAPLLQQLAGARRPRMATTFGLFLQLVLVLGAIVSLYQARQATASRVDWVTLLSPAVVGLAAGQVLVWLVLALLAFAVPRTRSARVGWFLTLRRLLRRADSLAVIRIVVAAGVVFGVAASASAAANVWREDRARLQVGGPVSYPVADGALRAYQAAAVADPHGRWLLPVASYTSSTQGSDRRIFIASDRWSAVVGDFFADTPGAELTSHITSLAGGPRVRVGSGGQMSATVVTSSLRQAKGLSLTFQYVDDHGDIASAALPLRTGTGSPAGPDLTEFNGRVRGCHFACAVFEVDIGGLTHARGTPPSPVRIVDASVNGQEMLGPGTGVRLHPNQFGLAVERDGATVVVTASAFAFTDSWVLGSFRSRTSAPALSTGGFEAEVEDGGPTIEGIDGVPGRVSVAAKVSTLPFAGTLGSALDLGRALVGSGGSIPDTRAVVLARSNTPPAVIAALRATHSVGRPMTYPNVLDRLEQTPRAQGTRLYLLVAAFAGLIALVSIASALAQQIGERRKEAASLRSVGVRARAIAGAYRREALLLALTTFVGTMVAAWLASRVLLPALPLVSGWEFAPPLDAAPRLAFIALCALVAAIVVGAATFIAFRGVSRASPPRILREDAP